MKMCNLCQCILIVFLPITSESWCHLFSQFPPGLSYNSDFLWINVFRLTLLTPSNLFHMWFSLEITIQSWSFFCWASQLLPSASDSQSPWHALQFPLQFDYPLPLIFSRTPFHLISDPPADIWKNFHSDSANYSSRAIICRQFPVMDLLSYPTIHVGHSLICFLPFL